jgi:hypothetical protein
MNFDLTSLALQAAFPTNKILTDDKGLPSVYVYIPKFKYSDVIEGGSDSTHPMFIVNGKEVKGIYISKYLNVVQNGRAYSLPCQDPASSLTIDKAISYCSSKGAGYHLMTRAEYAGIALWCMKNGFMPNGNNNYGKDSTESSYIAIPMTYDSNGKIMHTATGTGPLTWSHDGTASGIYDLNGNVSEWTGGYRLLYGEVQILENNDAADNTNAQNATSALWKAIDATTGELITPNGSGTTSNSVKADFLNNRVTYSTSIANETGSKGCQFANVTCDSTISDAAKEILISYGLLPADSTLTYGGDTFYVNAGNAESVPYSGGYYYAGGGSAGVFSSVCNGTRSGAYGYVGFRHAFVDL